MAKHDKITKEQQLKMLRKIRREEQLASGVYYKAAVHKSKKDKDSRKQRNLKEWDND